MPLFMLASASEGKKAAPATDAPAWRVAAGNLAAGATAGCAVEAGGPACCCPVLTHTFLWG